MNDLRYSDDLLLWEYRLAVLDEIDIEGMAFEMANKQLDALSKKDLNALKHALKRIDELKAKGTYEQERERLRGLVPQEYPQPELLAQDLAPLKNLFDGLDSADPEQKKRFALMADVSGIWGKSLHEAQPILNCLESAKKKKEGRPRKLPPWRDKAKLLEGMRDDISRGLANSVYAAAKSAAEKSGPQNTLENRAKDLARGYRKKMLLREQ